MSTTTSPVLNQSQSPMPILAHSKAGTIAIVVGLCTVMLVSIIGNILVIVIFRSHSHVKKQVTNHFLINLAISDLIVTLFTMPFWITWELDRWQCFPKSWDKISLSKAWSFIDITCEATSIANLAIISIDRLYSVSKPFRHHTTVTPSLAHKIILASWAYAVVVASIYLTTTKWKFVLIATLAFFIPLTIMTVCYTKIVLAVRACIRRWLSSPEGNRQQFGRMVNEYKTAKNLGIVMCAFVLCWLPFFVSSLLMQYCRPCFTSPRQYVIVPSIVKWLHYLNSALNPILYTCFNPSFHVVIRRYYAWCMNREVSPCTRYEEWFMRSRRTSSNSQQTPSSSLTIGKGQRTHSSSLTIANGMNKRNSYSSQSTLNKNLGVVYEQPDPLTKGDGAGGVEIEKEMLNDNVFVYETMKGEEEHGIGTLEANGVVAEIKANPVHRRVSFQDSDTAL